MKHRAPEAIKKPHEILGTPLTPVVGLASMCRTRAVNSNLARRSRPIRPHLALTPTLYLLGSRSAGAGAVTRRPRRVFWRRFSKKSSRRLKGQPRPIRPASCTVLCRLASHASWEFCPPERGMFHVTEPGPTKLCGVVGCFRGEKPPLREVGPPGRSQRTSEGLSAA